MPHLIARGRSPTGRRRASSDREVPSLDRNLLQSRTNSRRRRSPPGRDSAAPPLVSILRRAPRSPTPSTRLRDVGGETISQGKGAARAARANIAARNAAAGSAHMAQPVRGTHAIHAVTRWWQRDRTYLNTDDGTVGDCAIRFTHTAPAPPSGERRSGGTVGCDQVSINPPTGARGVQEALTPWTAATMSTQQETAECSRRC